MTETATIGKPARHGSITNLIDIVLPGNTDHHGTLFGETGFVERAGRSFGPIETKFWSGNLLTGERHITATEHFSMVAVNKDHRPVSVRGSGPTGAVPFEQRRA